MTGPLRWLREPRRPAERCLFLDRDGVINERVVGGYVTDWSGFRWRPGAVAALGRLAVTGLPMVVVSNQACIGRGLAGRTDIERIFGRMTSELERAGVPLAGWYCCPHAPLDGCACRKPLPGMLEACAADLGLDPRASFLFGDSATDLAAAAAVGCAAWLIDEPASLDRAAGDVVALLHRQAEREPAP